ncbi:orotate phosphoribosyltransferase [Chthonomonas calidirosea]|uniref:orotate phosphoribosyltransferase n=1 Tax=Chthonomonas calidirosea TaxID=454171 RepID=UPI0006DD40B1|nr:orotate phosphoribosyltransferase [Chthonomonas calidirosea]CEK14771.1 orotate phosphoribosyltransferase [Chthonomonas calidirosea]
MEAGLSPEKVREIFLQVGALRTGHFLLSSGRHSNEYWEKFWVLQYPEHVQTLCAEIARRFRHNTVDVVLGPTTGGILLAYEVARQLHTRALYAEKEQGIRCLRRGLVLTPNTHTLIVDDVMTTGGATRECIELAQRHQANIVGVAVLVDRSGGTINLGYRLEALLTVESPSYAPDECPLCRQGLPIEEPGTSRLR